MGGLHHQQPRLIDLKPRLRDPVAQIAEFGKMRTEGAPLQRALAHQLQRQFALPDGAHAMMHPPRTEPLLRQLKTLTLDAEQVFDRHAHVAEQQFAMPLRRVIVHDRNVAHDLDAGRIDRHQDHRMAFGRAQLQLGIGDAHHDRQPAMGMQRSGDEPFAAVDDVVIAVAKNGGADIARVGRGGVGLAHRKARADFADQQRIEPGGALLRRRGQMQQLHIAGVGRVAVEDFRRPVHPAHDLGERRVFDIG